MSKKDYRHVRKSAVIKNPSGQRIKLGGYRPDKCSSKDKKYGVNQSQLENLPSKVDLRPYMTTVENQGDSNSCTANAMAGAYEYLANRVTGQSSDVSRLFIYYNARALDGATDQDEGTYLKSCVRVLRKQGACSEQTWSFDLKRILERPYEQAYEEGAGFLIEDAYRVDVDLDAMRSCLAEGYPFAFGLELFASFQKAGSNGLVPMPAAESEQHDGGHAMLCVGYSDADKVFIVRNSWGEAWGDRGYCYIPYAYMTHPELNGDCWTIRKVSSAHVDLSEGIQGDSTSLFNAAIANLATAIQVPGAAQGEGAIALGFDEYEVDYEEQHVYLEGRGRVHLSEVDDLEALYYEVYEDEYEEDYEETEDSYEESESEEEIEYSYEETEETEYSYKEETEETEDSYEEETEDSYEESESEEEESEETEDSYEEESEESEEEESEETEDSYEESEEEESEEEESEEEESEEETEGSYEESEEEYESEEPEESEEEYESEEAEASYDEAEAGDDSYEEGGDE